MLVAVVVAALVGVGTPTAAQAADPQLTFEGNSTSVTQGDDLAFRVEDSTAGAFHVVSMAAADLRRPPTGPTAAGNATRVFGADAEAAGVLLADGTAVLADGRTFADGAVAGNGSETVDGAGVEEVFVLVEADSDGVATGEVNTSLLAPVTVDLNLFAGAANATDAVAAYEASDAGDEIHERSIRVSEDAEEVTIESPSGEYVPGERVAVSGTASSSVESVAVYVSDGADWQLVRPSLDGVEVDDEAWERAGVHLSRESPLFRVAGNYRIGVVAVADADRDGDGRADVRLPRAAFSAGTSAQRELTVVEPAVTGGIRTYAGQVAVEDGVYNVSGVARGAREVAVVFVDGLGGTLVRREPVDEEWAYGDPEVAFGDALQEGRVVSVVLSPGQDGVFGRGGQPPDSVNDLLPFVENLEDRGYTQEQVVAHLLEATLADDGSDDQGNRTEFVYTGASVDVESFAPSGDGNATGVRNVSPGEEVTVRGATNLRPDRNGITLELHREPTTPPAASAVVEDWNNTGRWEATLAVPDNATPGSYVFRADAGAATASFPVEVGDRPAAGETTAGNATGGSAAGTGTTTAESATGTGTTTTDTSGEATTTAAATGETTTGTEASTATGTTGEETTTATPAPENATTTTTGNAADDGPTATTTTPLLDVPAGQPGFGVAPALLAVLALAGVALLRLRRR